MNYNKRFHWHQLFSEQATRTGLLQVNTGKFTEKTPETKC